jgi:hypothetical protein
VTVGPCASQYLDAGQKVSTEDNIILLWYGNLIATMTQRLKLTGFETIP